MPKSILDGVDLEPTTYIVDGQSIIQSANNDVQRGDYVKTEDYDQAVRLIKAMAAVIDGGDSIIGKMSKGWILTDQTSLLISEYTEARAELSKALEGLRK